MIKQAVILCSGLGTRLKPYTDSMPKPMIPILGKPLIEWNIAQFKKYGVTEFFINLHPFPEQIKEYFGDGSQWGVTITYNYEHTPQGTAGGVKLFEEKLDNEFFLIYGDTLSLLDYSMMGKAWYEKPASAIGMQRMQRAEDYKDADVAEIDENGKFIAIHPKPHTETYSKAYRMRGAFILKKKILSYIPAGTYYEIGKDLLPDVVKKGEAFYSYECDDYSKGIDMVEKWHEVEDYLTKNHILLS